MCYLEIAFCVRREERKLPLYARPGEGTHFAPLMSNCLGRTARHPRFYWLKNFITIMLDGAPKVYKRGELPVPIDYLNFGFIYRFEMPSIHDYHLAMAFKFPMHCLRAV